MAPLWQVSIIDDAGVAGQQLLGLFIEVACHLVDMVLFLALRASHAHPAAHAMHFQFP